MDSLLIFRHWFKGVLPKGMTQQARRAKCWMSSFVPVPLPQGGARGAGIPSYGEGEGAEVYTAEKISFGEFLNQSYRNPTQVDYQKMVRRSS